MAGEPLDSAVNLDKIASMAEGMSGSDLKEMCRNASMYRVRDFMKSETELEAKRVQEKKSLKGTGALSSIDIEEQEEFQDTLRPITQEDMLKSLEKMRDTKIRTSTLGD